MSWHNCMKRVENVDNLLLLLPAILLLLRGESSTSSTANATLCDTRLDYGVSEKLLRVGHPIQTWSYRSRVMMPSYRLVLIALFLHSCTATLACTTGVADSMEATMTVKPTSVMLRSLHQRCIQSTQSSVISSSIKPCLRLRLPFCEQILTTNI